jgi:hypothetical protein
MPSAVYAYSAWKRMRLTADAASSAISSGRPIHVYDRRRLGITANCVEKVHFEPIA